jgi:hypothetical protein
MIPRTFPSSVASNGSTQMIVYFLPSVSGLTRWVDYIPVKFTTVATAATENTYNQNGYIPVVSLSSIAGATPFKEYVPVFLDSSAVDADVWDVTITGFIPVGTAGIGGAALYLDFAATTSLDPRITFSRTTNATVTGSNGLIQNAPMNLLTFSEQFDNAVWVKTGSTVSANTTVAPNGTTTADTLIEDTSTGEHRLRVTSIAKPASAVMTYSVYVKPAGRYFVLSMEQSGLGLYTTFDVTTNQYWDFAADIGWVRGQTVIADAGNGWYRCSISGTTDSNTSMNVRVNLTNVDGIQKNPSYTGNGTSGVFIWGAQLELGSTATTYNPTTVKNLLGFTENFDNAAWTKSNAFVQTNQLLYSQDFDNAVWQKIAATITANSTAAPDGTLTADTITPTTANTFHTVAVQNITVSNTSYTLSVRAKSNGYNFIAVQFANTNAFAKYFEGVFNLSTGTIEPTGRAATYTGTRSIKSLGNGWYECAITVNTVDANSTSFIQAVTLNTNDPSTAFAGNGTDGIYVWGAQLVQGTSAGDYKATYAAAAAVGYTDIYGQPFAQKLVETTAVSNPHFINQTVSMTAGCSYTATVYAKQGERQYLVLRYLAGGAFASNHLAVFDLQNGTVGTSTVASFEITPVGNGWYRCAITQPAATTGNGVLGIYLALETTSTYTGDGTSGIYIFGAQLSDSASVDPYVYQPVAAPTSTAYYGPRFDYDPVTLAPKGLLIEEQRTNLVRFSEDFSNAVWQNSSPDLATVTVNADVAPNGTTTANLLTAATGGTASQRRQVAASSSTGNFIASVFLKAGSSTRSRVVLTDQTSSFTIIGNFQVAWADGVASILSTTAGTASVVPVGNGWYRCGITASTATANATVGIAISPDTLSGTGSVYAWGAQLEAGAFATSYIPTVASQVTRAADSASMIGNNFARWYNVTSGTMFAGYDFLSFTDTKVVYNLGDNVVGSEGLDLRVPVSTAGYVRVASVNTVTWPSLTLPANTAASTAVAYQSGSFALSTNGANLSTSSATGMPTTLNRLEIGMRFSNNYLNGHIQRIAYYPRRLANTELQGITS